MTFKVGETVVYPHHGAATIEEITERELNGEPTTYLVLRIHQPQQQDPQRELIIQVPADKVDEVGVRDVVDDEGVEEVEEVLRAQDVEEPSNWSRRFKANQEKITSGDIVRVSEVVRDLSRRDADKGLSTGEKRMLTTARQILISELALAGDVDEEAAGARLDTVIEEGMPQDEEK